MILTFRPIKIWPEGWQDARRDETREQARFSATYSDTLQTLDRELAHLAATDVTLQVDASDRDLRLDGQLRSDAKVNHPGVILTIETRRLGSLVYSTDRFRRSSTYRIGGTYVQIPGWQNNLRAIALGLEALRKVERYGIAERGQQYAGYREIGSGIALGAAPMTVEEAARFLHDAAAPDSLEVPWERLLVAPELVTDAYRLAAKRLHPDHGGDPALFRKFTEARDLLDGAAR